MKNIALISVGFLAFSLSFAGMADGASKFLGNITTNGQVRSDFGTYWNQITAENECKWGSIEYTEGTFNWSGCDAAYNWAKENGGRFKFHALVWGSQYPNWLESKNVEETKFAIDRWFSAVAERYPDLDMIDVVNEAIWAGSDYHSGYTRTKIIEALGGDVVDGVHTYTFVANAFKMARRLWPNAVLIYNDYNTFRWQINEGIDLVKKIIQLGAPVDAYGQQAHDLTDMEYSEFKSALKKIHDETGIPLYITEYDIGTDDDALQLQRYKEQIPEFWNAEYVAGVTLWGYIYGSTWTTNGNSGIIKNGRDRPAMTWLKEYMAENSGVNTTGLGESLSDTVPQAPYGGVVWEIPGKIEAENYDVGGQGVSYFDKDVKNKGGVYREDAVDVGRLDSTSDGFVVGYTEEGEWLEYTVNVARSGAYKLTLNASSGADGASFQFFVDDVAVTDTVSISNGGSWDIYDTVSVEIAMLTTGNHVLKLFITGSYANVDWMEFSTVSDSAAGKEESLKIPNGVLQNPGVVRMLGSKNLFDLNGRRKRSR